MFLIVAVHLTAALLGGTPDPTETQQATTIRRIATSAALAAEEYGIGVAGGRVVAPAEVEEAQLFLQEARRSAGVLPPAIGSAVINSLDSLLGMVRRTAPPDSVEHQARAFAQALAQQFNLTLEEIPAVAPALSRGEQVYRSQCATCHGPTGRGDGPAAAGLTPTPADLTDFRKLATTTPLDFFRRVTIGVAGTSMPAYESRLSPEERWAVASYASTLRLPAARGEVPASLNEFATTATLSDSALAAMLAPGADPAAPDVRAHVMAVRSAASADDAGAAAAPVFSEVRRQLDSVLLFASQGRGAEASGTAFDAYMTFEKVERGVRAKNAGLANTLEAGFANLRTRAAGGATGEELRAIHTRLLSDLENAERTVSDRLSPLNLFTQSLILLLREGLEAILVVGALVAFLAKTGAGHRRRDIHVGVGAAIGASLLTAVLLETIFQASRTRQETLEGVVMLVATAMLFYVSYWLLSKMEVAKWNRFVKGRVQDAVSSGSALALASVAFLAVYREGFETVLFYKALFLAGSGSGLPVFLGMALASVLLAVVYLAINRYGVRIPLKPFFGFTSAFLYYMAFVFAGKGIAELQEGSLIGTTVLPWAPRIPALGIYPTLESLALQAVLVLFLVAGLVWTFVIEPRRLAVTSVLVPEHPSEAAPPIVMAPVQPLTASTEVDIVRSLDRMDADLAELRAEVERLRGLLRRGAPRGA
ncbi:MAG TPA: FTR1 family protein [Gemmatimonadales bacterium]|nr:FTR1 family protein [Gemmatimonadales bacterium]